MSFVVGEQAVMVRKPKPVFFSGSMLTGQSEVVYGAFFSTASWKSLHVLGIFHFPRYSIAYRSRVERIEMHYRANTRETATDRRVGGSSDVTTEFELDLPS